jgi:membrane protein insertase Oxa1/YidC/SpoIIIJ
MFGMISLSLSVGLSIYFIASNLVGVVQYLPGVKDVLDRIFRTGKKTEVIAPEEEELVPSAKDKDKPRKKGKST